MQSCMLVNITFLGQSGSIPGKRTLAEASPQSYQRVCCGCKRTQRQAVCLAWNSQGMPLLGIRMTQELNSGKTAAAPGHGASMPPSHAPACSCAVADCPDQGPPRCQQSCAHICNLKTYSHDARGSGCLCCETESTSRRDTKGTDHKTCLHHVQQTSHVEVCSWMI